MTASARPVLWDVYKEHLSEAAFLYGQWEAALVGCNYVLDEVASGPEERLRAHLDALVIGGEPVADGLLLAALTDDSDAGNCFAAAWALLHAPGGEHCPDVMTALAEGDGAVRPPIARALVLAERADLPSKVKPMWAAGDGLVQATILDALGPLDPAWAVRQCAGFFASGDDQLTAAALRALRRKPEPSLLREVEKALEAPAAEVRYDALATGYVVGARNVNEACNREPPGSPAFRMALAIQALSLAGPSSGLFTAWLADRDQRRHAIWALGFAGDIAAGDKLVALLDDGAVARIAAEALTAITGFSIQGELARPAAEPAAADDVEIVPLQPEDALPEPDVDAVKRWWKQERLRLPPNGIAYGHRRAGTSLRRVLATAAMWRRPPLMLELAASERSGVTADWRDWAIRQRVRLPSDRPGPDLDGIDPASTQSVQIDLDRTDIDPLYRVGRRPPTPKR